MEKPKWIVSLKDIFLKASALESLYVKAECECGSEEHQELDDCYRVEACFVYSYPNTYRTYSERVLGCGYPEEESARQAIEDLLIRIQEGNDVVLHVREPKLV